MATIRDVAKRAEVSIATVSRILAGDKSYKVTENTRQRVHTAVEELGYVVRSKARKTKAHNIGCVLAMTSEKYSDPYFAGILAAMESRLMEHDCIITMLRNYNELKHPQMLELAFEQELAGLVIMDTLPAEVFAYIQKRVPHIVGCDTAYDTLDNVGFDIFHATCDALRYLVGQGYRRIAYVGGMETDMLGVDRRMLAFRAMPEILSIPYLPELFYDCEWDVDKSLRFVKEILSRDSANRPDAIFAGNDTLASAILPFIQALGLSVPQDVAVMGFNNDPRSAYTYPSLTTVHVPVQEIGKAAADLLYARICGDTSMKRNICFPTQIVARASV